MQVVLLAYEFGYLTGFLDSLQSQYLSLRHLVKYDSPFYRTSMTNVLDFRPVLDVGTPQLATQHGSDSLVTCFVVIILKFYVPMPTGARPDQNIRQGLIKIP